MAIVMKNVRTTDEKFYVGMTLDEAKAQSERLAKGLFELDEDQSGDLSFDEIMNQRKQAEKKKNTGKNIWGGISLYTIFTNPWTMKGAEKQATLYKYMDELSSIGINPAKCILTVGAGFALLFTGITFGKYLKNKKWRQQDNEYNAQYQELLKAEQQQKETEHIKQIQENETEPHDVDIAA